LIHSSLTLFIGVVELLAIVLEWHLDIVSHLGNF
jgi:hypothetical protein